MLWFIVAAEAADPSPGTVLPSAAPVDAGDGELSFTAAHYSVAEATWGSGGAVRLGVAPTDRLWIEAAGAGLYDGGWCSLFGGACTEDRFVPAMSLAARYSVYRSEGFSIGPILHGAGSLEEVSGEWFVGAALVGAGLALEGGSERVRVDLALVGVANVSSSVEAFPVPVFGEVGVSFRIGSELRHTLRVGLTELVPEVSWRYEQDRWFLEAGLIGIPVALGGERIEVGVRF